MNDLCADIGYKSINHIGEQLCGDHVDVVEEGENSTVVVLADGLGSGVKASILSTLTSKIISTMMAEGLTLEDCVETIAQTLPICSVRGDVYKRQPDIVELLREYIAKDHLEDDIIPVSYTHLGAYTLTGEDTLSTKYFYDSVARTAHPIDIHLSLIHI